MKQIKSYTNIFVSCLPYVAHSIFVFIKLVYSCVWGTLINLCAGRMLAWIRNK